MDALGRGSEWVVAPLGAARRAEYYAVRAEPARGFDRYDRRMRPMLLVLGMLLIGAGVVFVAQGLDFPSPRRAS